MAALERAFAVDRRALGLFRIALGALVLYDVATRAIDLRAHYTDEGVMPIALHANRFGGHGLSSLHLLNGSYAWQATLFALTGVAALAMCVGFRTRAATIATWLLVGSMGARNELIWYAADTYVLGLLFWSMFLPLERFSIDERPHSIVEGRFSSAATAGLLLQTCFLYFFATVHKIDPAWLSGDAVYFALRHAPFASSFGQSLSEHRSLTTLATYGALIVEGAAPFLLLAPGRARLAMIAALAALHVSLLAMFDLGIFQPTSLLALLPFLPSERRIKSDPSLARNVVAALALALVAIWNVSTIGHPYGNHPLPLPLRAATTILRLDQRWSMFSGLGPDMETGWVVLDATLEDGTHVDLLREGAPFEEPHPVSKSYGSDRMGAYFYALVSDRHLEGAGDRFAACARWFERAWERVHPDRRVRHVEIVFVDRGVAAEAPYRRVVLYER